MPIKQVAVAQQQRQRHWFARRFEEALREEEESEAAAAAAGLQCWHQQNTFASLEALAVPGHVVVH